MKTPLITFLFSVLIFSCLFSQQVIELKNPSFEDIPRKGAVGMPPIKDWEDCGIKRFPDQTPPDIHPVPTVAWEVTMKPYDGKSYIGLVTRYTNTYESVSQKLSEPLLAGKCYEVSVFLAVSKEYVSPTQRTSKEIHLKDGVRTMQMENFVEPAELVIWGGRNICSEFLVLAHSGPVSNTAWEKYTLVFSPDTDIQFLTFGAFYKKNSLEPYNGHVLVDALSEITEIECQK